MLPLTPTIERTTAKLLCEPESKLGGLVQMLCSGKSYDKAVQDQKMNRILISDKAAVE